MASVIERTRTAHEDKERAEERIVEILNTNVRTHHERLNQQHELAALLERIDTAEESLRDLYGDKYGDRKQEISSLGGEGPVLFGNFYEQLREAKDYHRKFPDIPVQSGKLEKLEMDVTFSGEEAYGKYVDLHWFHEQFTNLPRVRSALPKEDSTLEYRRYLQIFHIFDDEWPSKNAQYRTYIDDLQSYLKDFMTRTQPLEDMDLLFTQTDNDLNAFLAKSANPTWAELRNQHEVEGESLVGSSKIKAEDGMEVDDPLFCNACKKKFAKTTVFEAHLKGKKHKRNVQRAGCTANSNQELLKTEYQIFRLALALRDVLDRTRRFVESKQAKNWTEIQADLEDESAEEDISDDDDDEEEIVQGIKDYPLDWDGKPIPYWLYKLHGLGVKFKCEICGNATYMGRRNFERHFQDWRHTHGLRQLGITNSKHFQEITKINDAIALDKKLDKDRKTSEWNVDEGMEYEDGEGNVVPKKTYEMMKRQGLIQE
mmetsp:Transcript_13985/g.39764  ORF Transcript_13985/g.39764 Transcript_13985/m.39764 type:complete len:485 (-) Transcript_13985:3-1457(-)